MTKIRSIQDGEGNVKYLLAGRKIDGVWMITEPLNNVDGDLIELLTWSRIGLFDNPDAIAQEKFIEAADDPEAWEI